MAVAAKYPRYAVANFSVGEQSGACGHESQNGTFVVRETAGRWRVLNRSGTVSCPVRGISNGIAAALGIPC
jgi:hypothetical protein